MGESSVLNQVLKNNKKQNSIIIRSAMEKTKGSEYPIPTWFESNSYYMAGFDEALALGTASTITSYRVIDDGRRVEAKITVMDLWDMGEFFGAMGGFYEDAYILQQFDYKKVFGYKTTYDVTMDMEDIYPEMQYVY